MLIIINVMCNQYKIYKFSMSVFSLLILTFISLNVFAQQTNPNNLPECSKNLNKNLANCWGKQKFINGTYEGDFKNGLYDGFGTLQLHGGSKYVGHFKEGLKNGSGKLNWKDGTIFFGEWKNNELNGIGTYLYKVNSIYAGYTGNWKNGLYDGLGIKVTSSGERLEGFWKNGSLVRLESVNLPNLDPRIASKTELVANNQEEPSQADPIDSNSLPKCSKGTNKKWHKCWGKISFIETGDRFEGEFRDNDLYKGSYYFASGDTYVGYFKGGQQNGKGVYTHSNGNKFIGEFKNGKEFGFGEEFIINGDRFNGNYSNGKKYGFGTYIWKNGDKSEGIYENGIGIGLHTFTFNDGSVTRDFFENAHNLRSKSLQKARNAVGISENKLNLIVSSSKPSNNGDFTLTIQTNSDTASLKLNGEELGGRADGEYVINLVARAGQETKLDIVARDVYGNTDTKSIVVTRAVADPAPRYASLNPARVTTRTPTDNVAIIIGIQNYKRVPKADFANSDASAFYDYAIRALGIKPENIKLLIDDQADEVEILTAFKNWLPVKVKKARTDVYVFYSGHGLPSDDGKNLYILPFGADKQFIDKTALNQQEIISALQASQPKSVTMFIDACYSGQIRTGDTLLASARPIAIKSTATSFPPEFTVFTASAPDQIASSSPELKHGIFSYYLMKGMEGEADENKDGRITAAELQTYVSEMAVRQALSLNRKQQPQMFGDGGRVLVGR
jgi:hypothetical protein